MNWVQISYSYYKCKGTDDSLLGVIMYDYTYGNWRAQAEQKTLGRFDTDTLARQAVEKHHEQVNKLSSIESNRLG